MAYELPWKIISTLLGCYEFDHPVNHPPLWMTQPNPILMLNLAGTGVLHCREEPFESAVDAEERDLFYLHADLIRYVSVNGDRPMRIIAFAFNVEFDNGLDFFDYYTLPVVFPIESRPALRRAILAINQLRAAEGAAANFERQRQMQIITGRLLEHATLRRQEPLLPTGPVRCAPAAEELNRHYAEPINIDRLARLCSVSRPHFFRLFHREFGMTPQQFQLRRRLREAQRLLLFTQQTIAEVAHETGWNDPFHFSRLFRRETGSSPSHFRTMYKLTHF